jgi:hypothetical protein
MGAMSGETRHVPLDGFIQNLHVAQAAARLPLDRRQ